MSGTLGSHAPAQSQSGMPSTHVYPKTLHLIYIEVFPRLLSVKELLSTVITLANVLLFSFSFSTVYTLANYKNNYGILPCAINCSQVSLV